MKSSKFTHTLLLTLVTCFLGLYSSVIQAEPQTKVLDKFEANFRSKVSDFLDTLDQSQQKECLQPMNTEARWHKQYTGGKREGIQIKKLSPEQKKSFQAAIKLILSDYGWQMAESVAKQDGEQGLDKYYIACFGDPRKTGEPFAFRLYEHHLTIVHLEIKDGQVAEFGPILLGANPSNLWLKDEELLMNAWKQQADKETLLEKGSGISSKLMDLSKGIPFTELSPTTQTTIKQAWQHRISIFTPVIQLRLNNLQKARGGWEKARVAFYNQAADIRSKDGGKWDFKCGLPGMVWDYEASRGHIHLSLCIHPLPSK